MRTTWRSCLPYPFVAVALAAALVFAPGFQGAVQAQTPPCGLSTAPTCDGECLPNEACIDQGGICKCVDVGGEPCGLTLGPPMCWGACPPGQACVEQPPGMCNCQIVPTLSEWGIIGMSLLMFGGVLVRRRRTTPRT
jgi:hypothetical protein